MACNTSGSILAVSTRQRGPTAVGVSIGEQHVQKIRRTKTMMFRGIIDELQEWVPETDLISYFS